MPDGVAHHVGADLDPLEFVAVVLLEVLREVVGAALVRAAERTQVELHLQVDRVHVALRIGWWPVLHLPS